MKKHWLFLLLVVLLAFALRVYRLDAVSLRGDEAFTVNFVQRTWDGLWRGIRFIEPNPPGLYLSLRAWIALAGPSEFATRFFSLGFGVLSVALAYRFAREILDARVAFIAAFLIAINPFQIWHSQDIRNYTLWPALSLAGLLFFWRWLKTEIGDWRLEACPERSRRIGSWKHVLSGVEGLEIGNWKLARRITNYDLRITHLIFYALLTYASLMAHYYETLIVVAENAFVAAAFVASGGLKNLRVRWKTLARWSAAQIALIAAYAVWILQTDRITAYNEASAEQSPALADILLRTVAAFTLGQTVPEIFHQWFAPVLTLALALSLIVLARQNRERALFLLLYLALPIIGVYIISLGRPLFLERYLTGIAPAYVMLFAIGLAALLEKRGRALLAALAAIFFIGAAAFALFNQWFVPAYAKAPDWRAVWQVIAANQKPGDIVVQNFTDDAMIYYRNRILSLNPAQSQPGCVNSIGYLPVITLPNGYFAKPDDEKHLAQLNAECQRIWFVPASPDLWDPTHRVEKFLTRHADLELDQAISTLTLQLYRTPREFEALIVRVNAQIGNAQLIGYRVAEFAGARTTAIATGKTLRVVLYWQTAQKIEQDYAVFLHLLDAGGNIAAQIDHVPFAGEYPTSAWETDRWIVDAYDLRVDAPPGDYTLVAGMYDPATLVRVPATDASGARAPNDRVPLAQISVTQ